MQQIDFLIIGGGAAGFFAAIRHQELHPNDCVVILEKTRQILSKVKISGGGRCNVTNAQFDPKELVKCYPRGNKELLGPFHRFGPQQTVEWFKSRGVSLKTEPDGRMFPITDSSQTIINCLSSAAKEIDLRLGANVTKIEPGFKVHLRSGEILHANKLLIATGSSPQGLKLAESLGPTLIPPVPSLFTFNVPSSPLLDLSGISVPSATVSLPDIKQTWSGPLLLNHWGFSGPAVLKLSAFAARELAACHYNTPIDITWGPEVPKRLRKRIHETDHFQMEGKTTYKKEFVTCGGVELKEINFKNMESKLHPQLHFAGEILNIDGITGGFNFQNAWTGGWITGEAGLT